MKTRFLISAAEASGFPKTTAPEFAFIGRSNVGKSTLLNELANARVARTSKTPGRTQLVNFFEVEREGHVVTLADLPGYGFARAPSAVRERFPRLIERYLLERQPLAGVLLLFDVRREPNDEDREVAGWLLEQGRFAVRLVVTKIDKASKAAQKPRLVELGRALGLDRGAATSGAEPGARPRSAVFGVSALTSQGIVELRREIFGLAGAFARGERGAPSAE